MSDIDYEQARAWAEALVTGATEMTILPKSLNLARWALDLDKRLPKLQAELDEIRRTVDDIDDDGTGSLAYVVDKVMCERIDAIAQCAETAAEVDRVEAERDEARSMAGALRSEAGWESTWPLPWEAPIEPKPCEVSDVDHEKARRHAEEILGSRMHDDVSYVARWALDLDKRLREWLGHHRAALWERDEALGRVRELQAETDAFASRLHRLTAFTASVGMLDGDAANNADPVDAAIEVLGFIGPDHARQRAEINRLQAEVARLRETLVNVDHLLGVAESILGAASLTVPRMRIAKALTHRKQGE